MFSCYCCWLIKDHFLNMSNGMFDSKGYKEKQIVEYE